MQGMGAVIRETKGGGSRDRIYNVSERFIWNSQIEVQQLQIND
jgi:hypothetical protein